eukprot:6202110-Pleurochrysis_carterae.AAC.1
MTTSRFRERSGAIEKSALKNRSLRTTAKKSAILRPAASQPLKASAGVQSVYARCSRGRPCGGVHAGTRVSHRVEVARVGHVVGADGRDLVLKDRAEVARLEERLHSGITKAA